MININYKTMLVNISKKGYSEADGTYGLCNYLNQINIVIVQPRFLEIVLIYYLI